MTKAKRGTAAATPGETTAAPLDADDVAPTPTPAADPAAWQHVRETQADRAVRGAGLAIALLLFAVAAIIALYNAMRIASIWFESRYVPIVQFVLASAIMFGCYAALRRINRR